MALPGIDKLRQKRQKEDSDLRIEHISEHSLRKYPPLARLLNVCPCNHVLPTKQCANAEVDEVECATKLHHVIGEKKWMMKKSL